MALAVSFTNSGMQREACDALRRWICHNPRYKHLILDHRSPLQGSPATPRRGPHTPVRYQTCRVLLTESSCALLSTTVPISLCCCYYGDDSIHNA